MLLTSTTQYSLKGHEKRPRLVLSTDVLTSGQDGSLAFLGGKGRVVHSVNTRFILAPEFYSRCLCDTIGQFNQTLFLLGLRIVDGDNACFAHASAQRPLEQSE